jgi:hypothetical protein
MTFKEAKSEMEKMLPNGVWELRYSHWQYSSGPETTCCIYIADKGFRQGRNWEECIYWAKAVLYPKPKETQDDPDEENEKEELCQKQ